MNKWRKKEFGRKAIKNFKKDYFPGAKFFFVKAGKEIVAFGGLRKVIIEYLGRKYVIGGICNIVAIKKGEGFGKVLISAMIKYLKKTKKTGLGFCDRKITRFYAKAGLKTKQGLCDRFALKNPQTGEIRFDTEGGDGLYLDGKDHLIKKILSTKSTAYYFLPDISMPHW